MTIYLEPNPTNLSFRQRRNHDLETPLTVIYVNKCSYSLHNPIALPLVTTRFVNNL